MPIVFAQPDPYNPSISAGFGAMEQEMRDRDFQLRALAARHVANRDGYGQGGSGGVQYFDPGGRPQGMGGGSPHQDYARNQLSSAEEQHMARLQAGVAWINQQRESGILTDEDAQDSLMQLHTGISGLQMRQQRAHVAQQQIQTQMLMEQHARQTVLANRQRAYDAQTMGERTRDEYDPLITQQVQDDLGADFSDNATGPDEYQNMINAEVRRRRGHYRWYDNGPTRAPSLLNAPSETGTTEGTGGAGGQRGGSGTTRQHEEDQWQKAYERIFKHVQSLKTDELPEALRGALVRGENGQLRPPTTRDELIQAHLRNEGLPTSRTELTQQHALREIDQQANIPGLNPDQRWLRRNRLMRANPATQSLAAPEARPIPEDATPDAMTAPQSQVLQGIAGALGTTNGAQRRIDLFRAQALFRQYGDSAAMPPTQRAFFNRAVQGVSDRPPAMQALGQRQQQQQPEPELVDPTTPVEINERVADIRRRLGSTGVTVAERRQLERLQNIQPTANQLRHLNELRQLSRTTGLTQAQREELDSMLSIYGHATR